jgi:hypothetical protein
MHNFMLRDRRGGAQLLNAHLFGIEYQDANHLKRAGEFPRRAKLAGLNQIDVTCFIKTMPNGAAGLLVLLRGYQTGVVTRFWRQ